MKAASCFIVLYLLFPSALCVSEEVQELMDMLHENCQEQTGAEEAKILAVRKGVFELDEKLSCYAKCLMAEMATISDDGIVDVEATIALAPPEVQDEVSPVVTKCGTQVGANPCENALLTFKCYYENGPKNFVFP